MRYQAYSLGVVDPISRTANCSECGFIRVKYEKQTSGNYEGRCALTCKPSYKTSYQGLRSLRNRRPRPDSQRTPRRQLQRS
ncbi:MAG: hypothetical protein QOI57_1290 [Rubrobacteraceae bacterium]|jgi:hypothetical protein|nr:hypothetical protein [Rubrobacteraceae bacterium]